MSSIAEAGKLAETTSPEQARGLSYTLFSRPIYLIAVQYSTIQKPPCLEGPGGEEGQLSKDRP